jgi:hypothetical protein
MAGIVTMFKIFLFFISVIKEITNAMNRKMYVIFVTSIEKTYFRRDKVGFKLNLLRHLY